MNLDKNTTNSLKGKENSQILFIILHGLILQRIIILTQVGPMINDEEPSPQEIA